MAVVGFTKLQEIFRKGAGLDIHKGHAKEITDIIDQKVYDLLVAGERNAKYNSRDVIWVCDVPLTNGLEKTIDEFKKLEESIEVKDVVEMLTHYPATIALEIELENRLPEIFGGVLLGMAKIMKAIDAKDKTVDHELINKAKAVLDLTM
ncbi:MAG: DUF1931 family protein [Epsilonproteobacteria bacterium]|nr:DUF1931 family protein [Campylobacterota bacterium]